MKCPTCESCEYAQYCGATEIMRKCDRHNKKVDMTNEEWIHSMTTEDLVSFLYRVRFMSESPWQGKTISEWLKEKHSE